MKFLFISKRLLCLVFCSVITNLPAQIHQMQFENITMKDGLPANRVLSMVKDSLGFFWYGTTLGLVRYDGQDMDVFRHDPDDPNSIPSEEIKQMFVDKNNVIFACTGEGDLFSFDSHNKMGRPIKRYHLFSKDSAVCNVTTISDGEDGFMYFWDESGLTGRLHKKSGEYTLLDASFSEMFDKSMILPYRTFKHGDTIFIGANSGLYRFSIQSQCLYRENLDEFSSFKNGLISIAEMDYFDESSLLLGCSRALNYPFKGIIKFNFRTGHAEKVCINVLDKYEMDDYMQQKIYRVRDKEFLFLPISKTPVYYNFTTNQSDTIPKYVKSVNRLNTVSINTFWMGKDNKLIIGSNQGLFIHEPFSYVFDEFLPYHRFSKYPNGLNGSYFIPENNHLVISSVNKIRIYDITQDTVLFEENIPYVADHHFKKQETEILYWAEDTVLILSSEVLFFDLKNRTFSLFENKPSEKKELCMTSFLFPHAKDIRNPRCLYFFRDGRLCYLDGSKRTIRHIPLFQGKEELFLQATGLVLDKKGDLWVTSKNNGLIRIRRTNPLVTDRIHIEKIDKEIELNDIHESKDGAVWLATQNHGLIKLESLDRNRWKWKQFTRREGFQSNSIRQISEDDNGRLWMQTKFGITYFDIKNEHAANFAKQHGINFPHNLFRGKTKDASGNIYISEGIGIIRIVPSRFNELKPPPEVYIKKFDINYKTNYAVWRDTTVTLPYHQNNLSFHVTAVNHTHAYMNRYKYKLVPLDKDWRYLDQNNLKLSFISLKPGKYTFSAKAANHQGTWYENGINLHIHIQPAFWNTWWFRFLYILTGVFLIFLFIRYRVKYLRSQELKLIEKEIETQNIERDRIAKDLHDEIGAQLSTLKMYIEVINRDISQEKDVRQFSQETQKLISQTIEDMRNIITDLSPQSLANYGYFAAISELTFRIKKISDIQISLEMDKNIALSKRAETVLFRITQELFNNTLKHAGATSITLSFKLQGIKAHLFYQDNGIGLPLHFTYTGNGLTNIQSRVKLLDGKLHINNMPKQGLSFEMIFPPDELNK
jgi:signal transduction histidine kinase